jgi:hypothetical protein
MSCRDEIRIFVSCGQDEREHGAKPTLASADPAEASGRIHPPVGWLVAGLVCNNAWPSSRSINMLRCLALCALVSASAEALPCARSTQHDGKCNVILPFSAERRMREATLLIHARVAGRVIRYEQVLTVLLFGWHAVGIACCGTRAEQSSSRPACAIETIMRGRADRRSVIGEAWCRVRHRAAYQVLSLASSFFRCEVTAPSHQPRHQM